MKQQLILAAMMATSTVYAANFGATEPVKVTNTVSTPVAAPVAPPVASGPQVATLFRIVKPDGVTVIRQGNMTTNTSAIEVLNLADTDAFVKSNGKCAFNVKYDEISAAAATGTTNRLYSNDTLIAQNTAIDLQAGVLKTIWTQPYLSAGLNTIRVVVNATGAAPSTKAIRVNVAGTCGAAVVTPVTPPPVVTTPPKTEPPKPVVPVTPPVVKFAPGSAEWNNLNNMYGYSNYGVTQLKGKGYARYTELVALNAAITTFINAKVITQTSYNSLVTSWNTFITEPAFIAAMKAIVPNTSGQK